MMKGLRTQEGEKFERFFALVQKRAQQEGKIFFLDSGDGRDIIIDEYDDSAEEKR